ncbi:hypothetical protein [Nocardia sp. NPDC051832]|uniref:hypothetical protein n=1 Tax=Nocardia sp. NPDC051832 TaxID=3155673 RepID=UPI0034250481
MRDEAQTRLRTLRNDYEEGQTRLLQLEQQVAGLREGLLRVSGAIQVLEELLADNSANGAQRAPEEMRVP